MIQYSFSTFAVKEENREACELCFKIASLEQSRPVPLLMLGESGSGKTHLLCAIVNHVRSNSPRAALAYVTAKEFPDNVRALAKNSRPMTRAPHALLLADQLEKFDPAQFELLEKIAPMFLEKNRHLVFASKVHPDNIKNFPDSLRGLVKTCKVAYLARPAEMRENPLQQIQRLKARNKEILQELELARGEIERLESVGRETAVGSPAVKDAEEMSVLELEIRSLQRALEETRKQRDTFQRDAAALTAANAEVARLRKQLAAMCQTEESAPSATVQALEKQVQQAEQTAKDARAEMDHWAMRAQAILQHVELNRVKLAESDEVQLQQIMELWQRVVKLPQKQDTPDTGDLERELEQIAMEAEKTAADEGNVEEKFHLLYSQLLKASCAIQNLSDRLHAHKNDGEKGSLAGSRPWYATPFEMPKPDKPTPGSPK